ncbi:GAF domain-containing protein [Prosthecomicrobium sp. N25]|uniref:GAF domain-containing protein n=1 Tax=Prosthecomicrobium sp. N25 TaxID=3129254 RepID=UPI00307697CA
MTDTRLARLWAVLAEKGQPAAMVRAVEEAAAADPGHRLFTLMAVEGHRVRRIHSSRPDRVPPGPAVLMPRTPWSIQVLEEGRPYCAADPESFRRAFPDSGPLERMGLGSVVNVPVLYDGDVLGTLNLLDTPGRYGPEAVATLQALAPVLVPAFLEERIAAGLP